MLGVHWACVPPTSRTAASSTAIDQRIIDGERHGRPGDRPGEVALTVLSACSAGSSYFATGLGRYLWLVVLLWGSLCVA